MSQLFNWLAAGSTIILTSMAAISNVKLHNIIYIYFFQHSISYWNKLPALIQYFTVLYVCWFRGWFKLKAPDIIYCRTKTVPTISCNASGRSWPIWKEISRKPSESPWTSYRWRSHTAPLHRLSATLLTLFLSRSQALAQSSKQLLDCARERALVLELLPQIGYAGGSRGTLLASQVAPTSHFTPGMLPAAELDTPGLRKVNKIKFWSNPSSHKLGLSGS